MGGRGGAANEQKASSLTLAIFMNDEAEQGNGERWQVPFQVDE